MLTSNNHSAGNNDSAKLNKTYNVMLYYSNSMDKAMDNYDASQIQILEGLKAGIIKSIYLLQTKTILEEKVATYL